jgi:hypothetical protein
LKLLALSKPNVSTGFNKLVKGLKTFPQLFGKCFSSFLSFLKQRN